MHEFSFALELLLINLVGLLEFLSLLVLFVGVDLLDVPGEAFVVHLEYSWTLSFWEGEKSWVVDLY